MSHELSATSYLPDTLLWGDNPLNLFGQLVYVERFLNKAITAAL
jgi:hypothetical protein